MTTNLQKFEEAQRHIDRRSRDRVIAALGSIPSQVWEVGGAGQNYDPQRGVVDKVSYYAAGISGFPSLYYVKRPSSTQVEAIQNIAQMDIDDQRICIHYHTDRFSAAKRLSDIVSGSSMFMTREQAEAKAVELREMFVAKEGQFNCRGCGRATDNEKKLTRTIIARQYPGRRKDFDYCSDQCAACDQMAHEG